MPRSAGAADTTLRNPSEVVCSLGSQCDVPGMQALLPQKLSATLHSLRVRNSEAPINSASYRSAELSDDKAAKGLKDEKRFPESENKLGLSSPAQALTCPLKEAPPEPLPDTFTWKLGLPDDDSPPKTALPELVPSLFELNAYHEDSFHPHIVFCSYL